MPSRKTKTPPRKKKADAKKTAAPAGYAATPRKDKDGRRVYTKGDKDYVRRKKADGTFGMRQAVHKKTWGGDNDAEGTETPKPDPCPYMIFLSGPTGSGKSKLRQVTLERYGLDEGIPHIGIDDLIEKDGWYKGEVEKILDNLKRTSNLTEALQEPPEQLLDEFEKAYTAARTEKGCKEQGTKGCDAYNDSVLQKALAAGASVTIEIVGRNTFSWFVEQIPKEQNYKIIYSAALAPLDDLLDRNKKRAVKSAIAFLSEKYQAAPRLPNVKKEVYTLLMAKVSRNLVRTIVDCFLDPEVPDYCGPRQMTEILLWDTSSPKDLQESQSETEKSPPEPELIGMLTQKVGELLKSAGKLLI